MCLIFVANRCVDGYRLLVVANRDEFHARQSAPVHQWDDAPDIIAGRDLEAGGTWLGVTQAGRFAALTNYSEGGGTGGSRPSRGALVSGFLRKAHSTGTYLTELSESKAEYSGFNLLVDDGHTLGYTSNRGGTLHALDAGIYGLSNHLLDTPWPKVEDGKRALSELVAPGQLPDADALFAIMGAASDLGVDAEHDARARARSQAFILGDFYGTRATTITAITEDGSGWLMERRFDADGRAIATDTLSF